MVIRIEYEECGCICEHKKFQSTTHANTELAEEVKKGYWLIYFEDADRKPEVFTDKDCAVERYREISLSWNAHLFERIDCNYKGV